MKNNLIQGRKRKPLAVAIAFLKIAMEDGLAARARLCKESTNLSE